jgi:hypothetical protein
MLGDDAPKPGECSDAIRTQPSPTEFVAVEGQYVCIVTDGIGETGDAQRPKLAIFKVSKIDQEKTITIVFSTWELPS